MLRQRCRLKPDIRVCRSALGMRRRPWQRNMRTAPSMSLSCTCTMLTWPSSSCSTWSPPTTSSRALLLPKSLSEQPVAAPLLPHAAEGSAPFPQPGCHCHSFGLGQLMHFSAAHSQRFCFRRFDWSYGIGVLTSAPPGPADPALLQSLQVLSLLIINKCSSILMAA